MTSDLRPRWLNVARVLQRAACRNNGIAVVSANIVVNAGGDPITWTEPDVVRLGPLSNQDEIIKMLIAPSSNAYLENDTQFLIAQVLDGSRIVINKGENDGVSGKDLFVHVDNSSPYAILSVSELRDRVTILSTMWVRKSQGDSIIDKGQPVYLISW